MSSAHPAQSPARLESLETRTMLSAVVSSRGTLAVAGTSSADVISIQRDLKRPSKILVTINGAGQKFDGTTVKRIEMVGGAGDDQITLNDSLGIISGRGATLWGDAGNDTLTGGLAGVTLLGGDDADLLYGSTLGDTVDGGNGNDTVYGGRGNDFVTGGAGADSLLGWLGDDQMYGDAGNDTLFGEDGNDTLGGDNEDVLWLVGKVDPVNFAGNDSLNGGEGNDWLVGGRQSVSLNDNNGLDTLTGGAGNDVLDSRGWANSGNAFDVITDRAAGDIVPMENHTRVATAQEIANGEESYAVHQHSKLNININDNGTTRAVWIEGNIGEFVDPNVANTFVRLHVHATQEGYIHFHDLENGTITLGEFFRSWGVTVSPTHIGRYVVGNGHTLTFSVKHGNGQIQSLTDPYGYVILGNFNPTLGDVITITYS